MKNKTKNILFATILILAGLASLNLLQDSVFTHAAGTIFLITGTYGLVSGIKKKSFIF